MGPERGLPSPEKSWPWGTWQQPAGTCIQVINNPEPDTARGERNSHNMKGEML